MISYEELQKNAQTRLKDAKFLHKNNRHDSALYLCGYAVELALKAVICKRLNLCGIPNRVDEFNTIQNIKTHNLETLLGLTDESIKTEIKSTCLTEWSIVLSWDPELRYSPIQGRIIKQNTSDLIRSAEKLLKYLWTQL